jgi:hypothetical protein
MTNTFAEASSTKKKQLYKINSRSDGINPFSQMADPFRGSKSPPSSRIKHDLTSTSDKMRKEEELQVSML